jgi:hypothetical protein
VLALLLQSKDQAWFIFLTMWVPFYIRISLGLTWEMLNITGTFQKYAGNTCTFQKVVTGLWFFSDIRKYND